jgi:hypothetical protein
MFWTRKPRCGERRTAVESSGDGTAAGRSKWLKGKGLKDGESWVRGRSEMCGSVENFLVSGGQIGKFWGWLVTWPGVILGEKRCSTWNTFRRQEHAGMFHVEQTTLLPSLPSPPVAISLHPTASRLATGLPATYVAQPRIDLALVTDSAAPKHEGRSFASPCAAGICPTEGH